MAFLQFKIYPAVRKHRQKSVIESKPQCIFRNNFQMIFNIGKLCFCRFFVIFILGKQMSEKQLRVIFNAIHFMTAFAAQSVYISFWYEDLIPIILPNKRTRNFTVYTYDTVITVDFLNVQNKPDKTVFVGQVGEIVQLFGGFHLIWIFHKIYLLLKQLNGLICPFKTLPSAALLTTHLERDHI